MDSLPEDDEDDDLDDPMAFTRGASVVGSVLKLIAVLSVVAGLVSAVSIGGDHALSGHARFVLAVVSIVGGTVWACLLGAAAYALDYLGAIHSVLEGGQTR